MLTVYAAWVEGAVEADVRAIRRAMYHSPSKVSKKRAAATAACESNAPPPESQSALARTAIRSGRKVGANPGPALMELMEPHPLGSEMGSKELPLWATGLNRLEKFGGADGTRTRDPRRDRPVF